MKRSMIVGLLGLHAVLVAPLGPAASAFEDPARIRSLAEAHALAAARSSAPEGARVAVSAARLDPRLQLAPCPVAPETFAPPGRRPSALASIGVRCPAGPGWSLYVPVSIDVTLDVVVLAHPAARGDALDADDLRLEPRNVARLRGPYLTRLDEAAGLVLRRPVRPGTALTPSLLEPPTLVRRGQRVRVSAGAGTFSVRTEGEALSDAAAGERVRIRNLRSRTVVEGVVAPDGSVRTGS